MGIFSRSLCDELEIQDIIDDVAVYNDGSVGCAYSLRPVYVDAMDEANLLNLEKALNSFVAGIDINTKVQIVWKKTGNLRALELHENTVQTADPIVQLMSQSRSRFWTDKKEKKQVFGVEVEIWFRKNFIRKKLKGKINNMWDVDPAPVMEEMLNEQLKIGADFKSYVEMLMIPLKGLTDVHRMTASEMFKSVWQYFCGENSPVSDYTFDVPFQERFRGTDVEIKKGAVRIGNSDERMISVLSVRDVPEYSQISIINYLLDMPVQFFLVMTIDTMPQGEIKKKINKQMRRYESYITQRIDPEAHKRAEDIAMLLRNLEETTNQIVKFEMAIVIPGMSEKELDKKSKAVGDIALANMNGMCFERERAAVWEMFMASSPGACKLVPSREQMVKTENISDFMPIYGPIPPAEKSVMLMGAPYQTLYGYDPFDDRLPAPHALIFGGSGKGKSFTANLLMLSAASQNPFIFIVDKGGSYKKLTNMLGGSYIDLSKPGFSFNPLEGKKNWKRNVRSIKEILSECVRTPGKAITSAQDILIQRWIQTLYTEFEKRNGDPTFSDAYEILEKYKLYSSDRESVLAPVQTEMKIAFSKWTRIGTRDSSMYAKILDNPETNIPLDRDVITFDLLGADQSQELMSVVFMTISNIIRDKATDPEYTGRAKLIVFDEVWSLLKSKEGANFIGELYRTMRKYRAMVMSISQSIEDFADSDVSTAILSNTYQMIVLGQAPGADCEQIKKLLKLNDSEKDIIENLRMVPKQYSEVFLKLSGVGAGRMSICPSPVEYWLATTKAEEREIMDSYMKQGYSLEKTLKILVSNNM